LKNTTKKFRKNGTKETENIQIKKFKENTIKEKENIQYGKHICKISSNKAENKIKATITKKSKVFHSNDTNGYDSCNDKKNIKRFSGAVMINNRESIQFDRNVNKMRNKIIEKKKKKKHYK